MDSKGEADPNIDRVEAADHENLVDNQGTQGLWKDRVRHRADNYLSALTDVVNDEVEVEQIASQFLEKVKLIASIHKNVLLNIEQA
ncbi:unnamed protein product [Sphagnum tenellum]